MPTTFFWLDLFTTVVFCAEWKKKEACMSHLASLNFINSIPCRLACVGGRIGLLSRTWRSATGGPTHRY